MIGEDCLTETTYIKAKARIESIQKRCSAILDEHSLDAVMWPTVPLEAQPIDGSGGNVILNGKVSPTTPTYIRNAASAGVVGALAISLPMGCTIEELPIGLELDGRPDGDEALIAIALGAEAVLASHNG